MKIQTKRMINYSSYQTMLILVTISLWLAFSLFATAEAKRLSEKILASPNGVYIVQMIDAPVVAYKGGVANLKPTKAAKGQKIDPNSPDVVAYVSYLDSKHKEALNKAGGKKLYDYRYSFNGFAAKMTLAQANKIASAPGVIAVTPDSIRFADTSDTPTFLGLTAEGGLWEQLGGPTGSKKIAGAGEKIIIGIIDSGIWPESLSFTDRDAQGRLIYQQVSGFHGKCDSAEIVIDGSWDANLCNKKLVAAQHFNEGQGGDAAFKLERPWEFMSPRDYNGHGTHTSSTAGGNFGVEPTGPAAVFSAISGMAPRARVAHYKALWSTEDASESSGTSSDLVAAIDQAVADGVDVINYSISGTRTNFADPVQISFLFAADAGIFVAAAAGNSGPDSSTVAHPGPWLTTVAAGTHNRSGEGSVTLGNGVTYTGASLATAVGPVEIVHARNSGVTGANPDLLRLCFSDPEVLDPAKVSGKIVVCERGVNARVDKSLAVKNAGGVGMVLINLTPNSLNADFHFVPTVHLDHVSGAAVAAYANDPGPEETATINAATLVFDVPAPFIAPFSSRGPLLAGAGDLLKPDVIAPGVDILASVAPPGSAGLNFNVYSGTSMSSPHVAGVAALLKHLKPSWSPMMIKSALMTSGYDVLDGPATDPEVIFSQGAGHINPNVAANPGLVYDSNFLDWLALLCGTTNAVGPATCAALSGMGFSFDPSDVNVASIAIGDLAGVQTVTRKVTNVGSSAATYNAAVTIPGITTVVSPSSLTLNPGETKPYTVTFTTSSASLDSYVGGQLTWSDGSHSVRSPVVLRPVALAAPAQVSSNGASINYVVRFGYTGDFNATPRGLVPAVTNENTIQDDPDDNFDVDNPGGPGTQSYTVNIPADTSYARFSLFNANVSAPSDLDVYVYRGTTLVAISGGGTSDEEVNLVNPIAGTYTVWVHGFAVPAGGATYTLFSWLLGTSDAGNMTVTAPSSATVGTPGTITLDFLGLSPATKYLGSVAYDNGVDNIGTPTIVRVDTP